MSLPSAIDRTDTPSVAAPRLAASLAATLGRFAGLLLPLAVTLGWEALVDLKWFDARLLPAPSQVLRELVNLAQSGDLFDHIAATLQRVLYGFLFGVASGTMIGAASGYWPGLCRLIDPTIQALRSIPSIAWVPMFILWFGIFETSKVALIALGVFFPIYLNLSTAIRNVDRKLVDVGRVFRFSHREMITRILLPAALPAYLVALRNGLGLGWMFVVAAELMGAEKGLGFLLVDGEQTGRPTVIVAALVTFALLGKATDWLIAAASRHFLRWQDSFGAAS